MAGSNKPSAMVPLIIVGACLFGFGAYQSLKPKPPEVNTGFVAPPENPRTMQAPVAPVPSPTAADQAAEEAATTEVSVKASPNASSVSLTDTPWLRAIIAGAGGNFRDLVLGGLKEQQVKGNLNCAPVLTNMAPTSFVSVGRIACTAKDGAQIKGDFDRRGDGDLEVEAMDGGGVTISQNDGDFKLETKNANP